MRAATNLRAVASGPEEPPKDINALNRADIAKRDWAACHIAADRRAPISIMPAPRWRYS